MSQGALFLDRDGVINVDYGYVYQKENFVFIENILSLCKEAQNLCLKIIVITNQSGIARGYYTEQDFLALNSWMLNEFRERDIHITDVFFSPYHPKYGTQKYKQDSFSRKPKPGMLFQAAKKYNLDLVNSCLVGDQLTDIAAGKAAGLKHLILHDPEHNHLSVDGHYVVTNIKDAITLLKAIYAK